MSKTFKVELTPNNNQRSLLYQAAGTARWAYNWALGQEQEHYAQTKQFLFDGALRKQLTQLKQTPEFAWLYQYSNNITKQAIKDCSVALKNFFKGNTEFPTFKQKHKTKPSFYHDPIKLKVTETHVRLEKIGCVRLKEHGRIPVNVPYQNPRITCDNGQWYISVAVDVDCTNSTETTPPIGIDLGIKDLAIISDGQVFKNINKSKRVRQLEKRKKRLQRRASRHYSKEVKSRCKKSRGLQKLEQEVRSVNKKIRDQHTNYIHQMTSKLVKTKPAFIVIEDLNVKGMIKNHRLAKALQDNRLSEVRRQLEYKCNWYGVELIVADRFYPSSKLCSDCGHKKADLKLSDRVYRCTECGNVMDRDLNAAINLMQYRMREVSA
jgi:putative transposase